MEEEEGSAATKLPMCNCEKLIAVQMSMTEKKKKKKNPDRLFWSCKERNLYENKSLKIQCFKIKV